MGKQTRREFLEAAGMAAAAVPILNGRRSFAKNGKRPNVIVIMSDDQGYGDLSCEGNKQLKTPHLDRMKREGVAFTNFYVCPVCAPTRACLMTGRYKYRTGVTDNVAGLAMMRPDEVIIAKVLSEAGYRTGMFGKWHLGENYPLRPMDRGFQETLSFNGGRIGNIADTYDNTYSNPTLLHNGKAHKYQGYCTDIFFDAAMEFIERDLKSPFFIYMPTNVVHAPAFAPSGYLAPFLAQGLDQYTASVYAMVANLDWNMGRLFAKLKQLGIDEDTVVIFFSDNGPAWPRGAARYNLGLRAMKASVYEGGIKVPFFARCPGKIPAGRQVDRIAAHIDIFPTVLEICGVPKPYKLKLDGVSVWPLMTRSEVPWPDRTLFVQWDNRDPEGWDLARPYVHCAVRGQRYKIVMTKPGKEIYAASTGFGETELYDIVADPREQNNIARQHPDIVFAMRNQYIDWFLDVSRGINPPVPSVLGAREANPITLSSRNLRGPHVVRKAPISWEQAHHMAKTEPNGCGHFAVDVRKGGHYEITYRFGPPEATDIPVMKRGEAFFRLGKVAVHQPIPEGSHSVVFHVNLNSGLGRVEAFMTGQRADAAAVSPFFMDVRCLDL